MSHENHNTLLIIDDTPDKLELMAFMLRKADYRVSTAAGGREGLGKARQQTPDLIISDVSMPGMDGIELCRRVRADVQLNTVPIMLVTSLRQDTDSVLAGLRAGADDYLEAPFEPVRLAAKVARLIERKRMEDALRGRETYYRTLIDNASDLISILNADGTMRYQSPSLGRLLGYEPEDLSDNSVFDFIHPEDGEVARRALNTSLQSPGGPLQVELRFRHKQGHWRHFVCALTNLLEDPSVRGIVSNAFDITEHRRMEVALGASEAELREVQRLAGLGSWYLDIESGALRWSEETFGMLGLDPALAPPPYGGLGEILTPESFLAMDAAVRQAVEPGAPFEIELEAILPDQSRRWVLSRGESVRDTRGVVYAVRGTVLDVTERKQAQKDLLLREIAKRLLAERQTAILNALPTHVCLLCGEGNILDANIRWKEFALGNGYVGGGSGIGKNYLEVCDGASGGASEGAREAADGIRAVISGESKRFELDYPCHSPGEQRWFKLLVAPLHEDPSAGAVVMHVDITEGVLARKALGDMTLELEAAVLAYRQVLGKSLDVICTVDEGGRFIQVSEASKQIWGYEPGELLGRMYMELVHPEDRDRTTLAAADIMSGIATSNFDNRYVRKDGTVVDIMWSANWSEADKSMFCVARDVSQLKQAERALEKSAEQLRQAQKLESVGRLAGGIAHDFNNMLTAINGYSDLTLKRLGEGDPLRHNIEEIKKAGERSASLTHQLLAFSRRQILMPAVLDLGAIVSDTSKLLQRLIGEDVQLVTVLNPKIGRVRADPGQVTQIIMNLVVNARDAMPRGGKLTIETANVSFDEEYAGRHLSVVPGEYVMLAVSDTGTGMSDETRRHIFEPFYTTKEVGRGTGLGLATVYGIVKQSGGDIWVYSEEGIGTTFKIYLPRVADGGGAAAERDAPAGMPTGSERILLVEDEEMVRTLARRILEECGYVVIEARDGAEALASCERGGGRIDLLMTDVVMPHVGGRELSERLALLYPQMRVLFTSGYTDDTVVRHEVIERESNFIQKPFTPSSLALKVREVLEGRRE